MATSVKDAMLHVLDGLPVRSRDMGASLGSETTAEEFTVALARLSGAEREAIVRAKFQKGDIWDQWHEDRFRAERSRWNAALRLRIPDEEMREKYLQEFRHCAWVARSWPEKDRIEGKCWTWFVKREIVAGKVVLRAASKGAVSLRGVEKVLRDDGEYICCLTPTDKPVEWRVCDLPVRDERTEKK